MDQNKLIDLAWKARENAYVPYSHFKVGACIALKDGTFVQGCNIENAAYGSTMCAERNAIANMITNGENGICRLIAVDRNGKAIPPCGACRPAGSRCGPVQAVHQQREDIHPVPHDEHHPCLVLDRCQRLVHCSRPG